MRNSRRPVRRETSRSSAWSTYADEDVDPELVKATISSTKIYGSILGRADTRAALLNVSAI